ncbi:MAG TPA: AI-2E family transporter [Candidatus Sulfotelmatobacter sp.]
MESPRDVVQPRDVSSLSRLLILVASVVAVMALYFGRQVLIPLAAAIVLAFLLTPVVELLEKTRIGRVPSVIAVLVLFCAVLGGIGWGVSDQLMEIFAHLPDYRENIHEKVQALRSPGTWGLSKATAAVNDLSKELTAASETAGQKKVDRAAAGKQPIAVQVATPAHTPAEYLRDLVGPLAGVLETFGIVVVFALFILMKREDLRNRLLRLAGSGQLNVMTQALDEASQRLGRYLLLQSGVNAAYGVLFGVGTYFIGIPQPLLWGVLAGLLRFVPFIGTPLAAIFPMGMALAVFPGWSHVGMTFALFLFLELTIANLIEPWLYGSHTGISSLAILVAAIFWAMLWGPVGLILSTPLTLCLVLMGRYIPELGFLEILLSDAPVLSPQAHFYQRLLALDEAEAREIAEKYLKENPIGTLYDSVLIPALSLAERDRHTNVLDDTRVTFIYQSARELIDDLYEVSKNGSGENVAAVAQTSPHPDLKIVCVPARDEADEIVGIMVMQILRRAGYNADALCIDSVSTMLQHVTELKANVVCVSALPPFAAVQAKSLCKQLRQRCPKVKIVLGLWQFPGGVAKAQERVGLNCADMVGTSLAQVVSLMEVGATVSSS